MPPVPVPTRTRAPRGSCRVSTLIRVLTPARQTELTGMIDDRITWTDQQIVQAIEACLHEAGYLDGGVYTTAQQTVNRHRNKMCGCHRTAGTAGGTQ